MIKIGCTGFPVGRKQYESKFGLVEVNQFFDKFPMGRTIEKWKAEAPKNFEFIVWAPRSVTHLLKSGRNGAHSGFTQRSHKHGYFQDSAEVRHAFGRACSAAQTLDAKMIFFKLPKSLSAHSDNVGRIQKFFMSAPTSTLHFVWEPPTNWPLSLVSELSKSLGITPAVNPLGRLGQAKGAIQYFRLGNTTETKAVHSFSSSELKDIKRACTKSLAYVIFNNGPTSFQDAVRFSELP